MAPSSFKPPVEGYNDMTLFPDLPAYVASAAVDADALYRTTLVLLTLVVVFAIGALHYVRPIALFTYFGQLEINEQLYCQLSDPERAQQQQESHEKVNQLSACACPKTGLVVWTF